MTFKERSLLLVVLGGPALLGGLVLQQLSCSLVHACLQVALEFQPEGRQQFSSLDFWRGAVGYGLGLWAGLQLGWLGSSIWQDPRKLPRWRAIAWRSALGVLLGLLMVYIVTASRWGVDIPQPSSPTGTPPPTHIALEWPGADHIPDAVEWWILVLCSWAVTVSSTWWLTHNVIRDT
jgi:hypothetical protein